MTMQTYFIGSDKFIRRTESLTIVEKSNLVDKIHFLTPQLLNDEYDMTGFDCVMECHLPISKKVVLIELVRSETLYDNSYVEYTLPTSELTTRLTVESGDVNFYLHFMRVYLDADGNKVEQSWTSANYGVLKVIPLQNWFSPTDSGLSDIAQMYLANKATIEALNALANTLYTTKADNIKLDQNSESIYLTANGDQIGTEIPLEKLNQVLVEIGGSSPNSGNISIQT